jgi:dTMP kinase
MLHEKGLLISAEGCDGSGKSSALERACARLNQEGYSFLLTREPGGNKISEKIRNIILDIDNKDEDIKTEALLYAASRRQLMAQQLFPLLDDNQIVITDRFVDSSLAYQGYGRDLGADEILKINMFAIDGRFPNWTLFFDLDPEEGLRRISSKRGEKMDRLDNEKLSFHQKVYDGYKELEKKYSSRYISIDASKSMDEVYLQTYKILKEKIDDFLAKVK